MRSQIAALLAAALLLPCGVTAQPQSQSDDAIGRILRQYDNPAAALPTAPPRPAPVPVAGPSPGSIPTGTPPIVMTARLADHEDRTRLVIELSDPVNLRAFTLAGPNRIILDMPEVAWRLTTPPRPSGSGPIKSYRYGLFRKGNSRMVIDLGRPVAVSDALVLPPSAGFGYRVVIDLFPTTQAKFDANAGWPADLKKRENDAEKMAALGAASGPAGGPGKKIIVIDPGHGGIDSGTNGVNGLMEKDLVLAEGLRLARVLRARGYSVHMTRDSDVFIPLPGRVAISRAAHADLFISLHADSNPDSSVSGLSVYTLSNSGTDKEAAALARKENQSDVIAGVDLAGANATVAPILIDLAQRDTINKSVHFAEGAVSQLAHATDILPRVPHRSAGFAVLKAPDVPAVLIELGYLSNRSDASQMNTESWRAGVAEGIADAVDHQFAAHP